MVVSLCPPPSVLAQSVPSAALAHLLVEMLLPEYWEHLVKMLLPKYWEQSVLSEQFAVLAKLVGRVLLQPGEPMLLPASPLAPSEVPQPSLCC